MSFKQLIADKNYDRTKILAELAKSSPTDPIDQSTGLSSYVLPLCQAFMGDPEKMVFLNFVDKTT
ncbi:hypothetical protein BGX27_001893, partial [Mortierella sp. AM989]